MNAAIEALRTELTKAEKVLGQVKAETKNTIDAGTRAQRELNNAERVVSDLKDALAALNARQQSQMVQEPPVVTSAPQTTPA
jgi:chromosome segregation ATPase